MATRLSHSFVPRLRRAFLVAGSTGLFLGLPEPAFCQDVPAWADSAYALIQADLHRLLGLQQAHFNDHGAYSADLETLGCESSPGVNLGLRISSDGFAAAATHRALGGTLGCAVYLGNAHAPIIPVEPSEPGRIACTGEWPAEPLAPLDSSPEDGPAFTPYDVPPALRNPGLVMRALQRRYPTALRDLGIGGTTQVTLHICDRGTVLAAILAQSSGRELLDQAALKVAKTIRFVPARLEGEAVSVWVTFPITFTPGGGR